MNGWLLLLSVVAYSTLSSLHTNETVGAVGSYYFLYTSLANSRLVLQSSHDQHVYPEIWKRLHPGSTVSFEATIRGALEKVREIGKEYGSVQTLVTGSQHLVGGVLSLLESSARV